jgi:uncharacterized protein
MRDHRFEWDDDKARANLAKHKISFEDARRVFGSRGVIEQPDLTEDYGEERYRAIGFVDGMILAVFYTLRGERTRIISARRASRKEERDYAEGNDANN